MADWQDLHDEILRILQRPGMAGKSCWVAYSGGLDSSVLLHAVCKTISSRALESPVVRALHINHGLSPHAADWATHCQRQANLLDVPIDIIGVNVVMRGEGVEAAARRARYQVFEEKLKKDDCLLQGHHLNDQAETVLFRLFRGQGVEALAGIPEQRKLGQGVLYRPLLRLSRDRLMQVASSWGINWVDDESNGEQSLDRNYIRHRIIPPFISRWPRGLQRISKATKWLREAHQLAEMLAELDLATVKCELNSLDTVAFHRLASLRQKNLLKHWLKQNLLILSERHLDDLLKTIRARKSAASQINFENGMALHIDNRSMTCFHLTELQRARKHQTSHGLAGDTIDLGNTPFGKLQLNFVETSHHGEALIRAPRRDEVISVRYREGGEKFRPMGRKGSCTLKKWLNEKGISAWKRSLLPIVCYNNEIVAIADLVVDETFVSKVPGGYRIQVCSP